MVLFKTPLKWFFIYTVIGFCSAIWSVHPALSGYRAVECFSLLGVVIICALELYRKGGIQLLIAWILRYTVLTSLFRACWRIPDWNLFLMASQMDATIFFYFALLHEKSKLVRWCIYVFSIFSHSTTAYIGLALGGIGLWFDRKKGKTLFFILSLLTFTAILYMGTENVLKRTIFSQRTEISLAATSGRDKMWELAWNAFDERPLLGYGFFAGEPYILRENNIGGSVMNAHNSISSAAIGTGLLGLIPLCIFFLKNIALLFSPKIPVLYRGGTIGCFAVVFLHCMGNPGIGSRVYGSWLSAIIYFVLLAIMSLPAEELKK